MAQRKGKVIKIAAPKVGTGEELGATISKIVKSGRKRTSNNPSRVPTNEALRVRRRLPTADELLRDTATPPLGQGTRLARTPLPPIPEALPTAEELLAMDPEALRVGVPEEGGRDRTEVLSPPPSLNNERPRAREAQYDPDSRVLRVVFRSGGSYEYFNVPPQTWRALKTGRSFGQTLDRLVIGTYPFEKVAF